MIRLLENRDISTWTAMRGRLWPEASSVDLQREGESFADDPSHAYVKAIFLAEIDVARPVGFIELSIRDIANGCDSRPIPYVEGWYVEPAVRGRGIGRKLMYAAEAWARERGFSELASDAELHDMASQRAHVACGYEETDRLVTFRKPLGP